MIGVARYVLDARHERVGVVLGPYQEAYYDLPRVPLPAATGGVMMVQDTSSVPERESVSWWQPGAQRWSKPTPEWSYSLDTIMAREYRRRTDKRRTVVDQLRDIEDKLRRDKGLKIGSDDNDSTWYAVNRALGVKER